MKKIALGLLAVGLAFAGCKKEMIEYTVDDLNDMNYKQSDKVALCHLDEYGNYVSISVAPAAVAAHMAHGDMYPNPDGSCGCAPDYSQDFSVDASGWNFGGNYGNVTYNSVDGNALLTGTASGPYTYYGDGTAPYQYRATWPVGGWYTTLDVYLDPNWADNTGFDFSVASRRQDETHLRDNIFHVGVVNGYGLLVNASNNADFYTNSYKLLNENGGNYYTVNSAGWYTFRQVFYDNGGILTVDYQLLDSGGNLLWTVTRSNPNDYIATVVGGNSYGWFTHIDVSSGIIIDNQAIYRGCQP